MNTITKNKRPDTLTKGDYIYSPNSHRWEPVKDAHWSEAIQRFYVLCGPLGGEIHTYPSGSMVTCQRYYY